MQPLKDIDYKIISEHIKNSRISDRELAKKVGVSQPTITRKRTIYEKERLLEYTSIPNFQKLGIEIMAFTFAA
jgi:DNA-binding Lrp family transcriptional regulator